MADAAEIAQDTLYSAYRRWSSLDNPRAWSFTVASRALIRRRIDGANEPAIFFRIVLRILMPCLVTVYLFNFISIWNNFFLPLIVLHDQKLWPVTLGLYSLQLSSLSTNPDTVRIVVTGSLVGTIPLVYREHAARITTKLAQRYSAHPALVMWHISNEYGPIAYNEASSANFRRWLRRRYGAIDALNNAWTTRFWGQVYTGWDQVEAPGIPRTWMNPARILDFKRFHSDALLECFIAERDIVRSFRDDIPVMTNFMQFYRHADYWRWAPEVDVAALDVYPDPAVEDALPFAAFQFDLFRSLKRGQPWLLMEQAVSAVSQWQLNVVKEPGRMRLGSLQAVSRGSDSVMFSAVLRRPS